MGVYDELSKLNTIPLTPKPATTPEKRAKGKTDKEKSGKLLVDKSISQSIDQSTNKSTNQPTNRSIDQLAEVDSLGPIVDRPRAFYITQKVDTWLDEGVRHLREKGMHKADRSVLVNALLHDPVLYQSKHLKEIRQRLLAHFTNKSLKRAQ